MKLAQIVSLATLIIGLTAGCGYSPSAAAKLEAKQAVKEQLTSPGSAKFKTSRIAARSDEERLYVVYLEIDSQNKFGALLRSYGYWRAGSRVDCQEACPRVFLAWSVTICHASTAQISCQA